MNSFIHPKRNLRIILLLLALTLGALQGTSLIASSGHADVQVAYACGDHVGPPPDTDGPCTDPTPTPTPDPSH